MADIDLMRGVDIPEPTQLLPRTKVHTRPKASQDLFGHDWQNYSGQARVVVDEDDPAEGDPQHGHVKFVRSMPGSTITARVVTWHRFAAPFSIVGWYRVATKPKQLGHSPKLLFCHEDNQAMYYAFLGDEQGNGKLFKEDRVGESYDQKQAPHGLTLATFSHPAGFKPLYRRHRFRVTTNPTNSGALAITVDVDGRRVIDYVDDSSPLFIGNVGWRHDGIHLDWSLTVISR